MKDTSTATERVGRYQLLEPIGGGPNGAVSRAKVFGVAGFERQFAVKRFLPELTVGSAAQALSQAARAYGSLEHPRIARMSEFGVAQGQTFTAVELVSGLDVFRLMQECKLAGVAIPPGGALALVSQAARAVGYAHGRGLSHWGLSPTNVIVTVDGDVKVTDFGILAATMPPQPVESQRLAHRIPYLAPEQIAGEATSTATDVFVLGVLAYELVTGQRAFRGDTPQQVAQAILATPPAEPPLPRPIVRVLQRCLARSPFERFPDARALADALDAALRVAPVPGTRKDIGAQIKTTLDRYATLNEGNLSGMVALSFPAASGEPESSTTPFFRDPSAPGAAAGSAPQRPEARTEPSAMPVIPQTLKPTQTVPGLAPPPIPSPSPAKTIMGIPAAQKAVIPQIPSIVKKAPAAPPPPLPAHDPVIDEPSGLLALDDSGPIRIPHIPLDDTMPPLEPRSRYELEPSAGSSTQTIPARPPKPTPGQNFESQTGEMSSTMIEQLNRRATQATSDIAPLEPPPTPPVGSQTVPEDPVIEFANDAKSVTDKLPEPTASKTLSGMAPVASSSPPPTPPRPSTPPPLASTTPTKVAPPPVAPPPVAPTAPMDSNKLPKIALAVLLVGALGAGGYYLYNTQFAAKDPTPVAAKQTDAAVVTATVTADAAATVAVVEPTATIDAALAAVPAPDAAQVVATVPVDAAPVAPVAPPDAPTQVATTNNNGGAEVAKPSGSSDSLEIKSKPGGARVFIDGADQGTTPVKLAGSTDRHTLAVFSPGHELYIAEVDGHGVFDVALKPVTPTGGHAGIKVLKCKDKERYYVYVDGNPTGMTCPSERIDTTVGPHTVEIYDIVTESRRKFEINVKDERLSERVRIEQ